MREQHALVGKIMRIEMHKSWDRGPLVHQLKYVPVLDIFIFYILQENIILSYWIR